jgi:hypothetical protein
VIRALARFSPVGRVTALLWAWRNRRELGRWLGFAWRAIPPSTARREDLMTEGRLRAALSAETRTRGLPSLVVRVRGGLAVLEGRLSPDSHDLVHAIAEETKGIREVECRIGDRSSRRPGRPHAHTSLRRRDHASGRDHSGVRSSS